MSKNEIVQYAQPPVPAVSFGEMERLAVAIAKSNLFGIKTPDQALALMALAQAEGRHPATVARDYHIIGTSPSKKAEAMQRDFLGAGGKIEWKELTDEVVEATFSHPLGGTATIRWDTARCKQANLIDGNHKKYPRQMKRSRVVSEGVRTVWPMATSGMYEPGEVAEFVQSPPTADTRAELDAFAAAKPAEVFDAETGELFDVAALEQAARAAATSTDSLRSYLRTLSREARASLNGKIGTRDEPGEILRMAMRADAEIGAGEDPFGLPPLQRGEPQPQEDPRLRRLRQLRRTAGIPDGKETPDAILLEAGYSQEEINEERSTRGWPQSHSPAGGHPADGARDEPADQPSPAPAGEHAIPDLLGGEPRPASRAYQLPPRPTQKDMQAFADWIDGELADGVSGRLLRANNDTTLRHMKVNVPDMYNVVQSKLGAL